MGQADYYLDGSWNVRCQECDKKLKSVDVYRRWDGMYVGRECLEPRNPQDFVRGIPDNASVPWATGNPDFNYIGKFPESPDLREVGTTQTGVMQNG